MDEQFVDFIKCRMKIWMSANSMQKLGFCVLWKMYGYSEQTAQRSSFASLY